MTRYLERMMKPSQAAPGKIHQSIAARDYVFLQQNNQGTIFQMIHLQNVPQSSTGADAKPNPSTQHTDIFLNVADPVTAHAQLPQ